MLRSFADKDTEAIWKLLILDAAMNLNDLRVPPGNRLEKLKGDRVGHAGAVGSGP